MLKPYTAQVLDYKALLFYHLSVISRASANLQAAEEKQLIMGQDPAKSFWQSVKTLDAFLSPYFDDGYHNEKKTISTKDYFTYGVELLGVCMRLLDRKGWALIEDIGAEIDDEIDPHANYDEFKPKPKQTEPPADSTPEVSVSETDENQ